MGEAYGLGGAVQGPGDPGTLDLRWYGIGFVDAVKRFFQKYARFDGRASRGEYWWAVLAGVLLGVVWGVIAGVVAGSSGWTVEDVWETGDLPVGLTIMYMIALLFSLAILVPSIAITVRRLHDANFSGWFYLLVLVPFVGGLAVTIMCIIGPNPQGQRFDR